MLAPILLFSLKGNIEQDHFRPAVLVPRLKDEKGSTSIHSLTATGDVSIYIYTNIIELHNHIHSQYVVILTVSVPPQIQHASFGIRLMRDLFIDLFIGLQHFKGQRSSRRTTDK